MNEFVRRVAERLQQERIAFRTEGTALRIPLPNKFGELEVSQLEDGDTLVELVDSEWHTHGDLLKAYGSTDEVDATVSFIKGIFEGEFFLVEETDGEGPPRKTIEDDLDSFRDGLPESARYKVFNLSEGTKTST